MLEEFYGKGDVSLDTAAAGTFTILAPDANLGLIIDPIGGSALAVNWALEELPREIRVRLSGLPVASVGEFLCSRLRESSQQIWHRGQRERLLDGIGACTAIAHVRSGTDGFDYCVAWAGDCRAYLRQDGAVRLLSRDDYDPQIFTARPLTQYLGTGELEPQFETGRMKPGDSLLLCTQGLARTLTEVDLIELWRDSAFAASQRLMQAAASRAESSPGLLVMQPYGTS